MNDNTIAFRAKEQLGNFPGKVFTHFSKPRKKSLSDMLYGIQASGDMRIPRGAAEPPKAVSSMGATGPRFTGPSWRTAGASSSA